MVTAQRMVDEAAMDAGRNYQAEQSMVTESQKNAAEADDSEVMRQTKAISQRDFSYDELVAKGDLVGFTAKSSSQGPLNMDGSIDGGKIVSEVRKKLQSTQTQRAAPTYFINVPDIDNNVEIVGRSITHGLFKSTRKGKKPSPRDLINAQISLEMPEILSNSIEVNRSFRGGNIDILYPHIIMGTVGVKNGAGKTDYYAVRSVIEERKNRNPILVEMEILGKLHAVNAKKK